MMQRKPAVERTLASVNPAEDKRVKVLATLVAREPEAGVISVDDASGKTAKVFFDSLELIEKLESLKEGQLVLIVGLVVQTPEGYDISGELIVPATLPDRELKQKVDKIWNEEIKHDI